jgi:RNA polymerase sigma-70 factor, ECF subfamily
MDDSRGEVTALLEAWGGGETEALDRLMPLVYDELKRMAKRYMNSQSGGGGEQTLQTTALIHEAYLKLAGQKEKKWQNRAHFFAVAARAMRHIMVDHARGKQRGKRGGDAQIISLENVAVVSNERAAEVIALDEALDGLLALDERKGRVVELRYFGGLSVEETAEVLKISSETVTRDWRFAKSWLLRELSNP